MLPNRVFRARLDYQKYSMVLEPSDDRSLVSVVRFKNSLLKSIVVESKPVVVITYRRCQFYLSPFEWSSYVTKNMEVWLFRAVEDCVHITFPVTMLWKKKPLSHQSIPIVDVLKEPSIRVYDVSYVNGNEDVVVCGPSKGI